LGAVQRDANAIQALDDKLLRVTTPEQSLEDYGSNISLENIAIVQEWMKALLLWEGKDYGVLPESYRFMF
jgi:hypothetical protein